MLWLGPGGSGVPPSVWVSGTSGALPKHPGPTTKHTHKKRRDKNKRLSNRGFVGPDLRSEKVHPSSNGPGRARLLLKTITIEMFGPVGPKIGPAGPQISIVIVIGPDAAEPGLLWLLCAMSLSKTSAQVVSGCPKPSPKSSQNLRYGPNRPCDCRHENDDYIAHSNTLG